MNNTTDNNNPDDDTSTINGDISLLHEDASTLHEDSDSTLNGSVINAENNSKQLSDAWLNSLSRTRDTKEMKDRRKKRRSRKDRNKELLDSPGGLTLNNLKAHDVAQSSNIRHRRSGDESSVYSQDTDGFYTSMHIDSGLKQSLAPHYRFNTVEYYPPHTLHGTTVPITLHNNSKANGNNHKQSIKSKKVPPPLPRRTCTLSEKDNRYPPSPSSIAMDDELETILAASSFSLNSTKSTDSKTARHSQAMSETNSTGMNESVVSESDTEAIYSRVKNKTNISSAGFPSLVSVTPLNSEDEDTEMLGFSHEWRSSFNNGSNTVSQVKSPSPRVSLQLSTSTPVTTSSSVSKTPTNHGLKFNPILEISTESSGAERSLNESGMSLEMDISGMDLIDTSVYSTWPRKPKTGNLDGEKEKTQTKESETVDFKTESKTETSKPGTYVRSLRLFNVGSLEDIPSTRDSLPEVKTPDGILDSDKRTISQFSNTFHIPSDHKFTFDTSHIVAANKELRDDKIIMEKPPSGRKGSTTKVSSDTTDFTSTWPRKRNGVASPKFMDDSFIECSKTSAPEVYELDEKSWTNSFPRRKKKVSSLKLEINPNTADPVSGTKEKVDVSLPQPAQAKLIISSPVSNQSSKIDNPHKRSLCSPVSNEDFVAFSQGSHNASTPAVVGYTSPYGTMPKPIVKKSSTMFEFSSSKPEESFSSSVFKPVSEPLYPSISAMKHSVSFPETMKNRSINPSTNNRSWYDNSNPYVSPNKKISGKDFEVDEESFSQTGYPFAAFLNESFLSTLESGYDSKRQSVISNNSTNSSGSGKKSVTFATDHSSNQSKSQKSDSVYVSSNDTPSRSGLAGILTSFKRKSVESLKSNDSGKSSKSCDSSVRLRSGRTIEVTVPDSLSLKERSKTADAENKFQVSQNHHLQTTGRKNDTLDKTSAVNSFPLKLKRSSALLEEGFDVESYDKNADSSVKECSKHLPFAVELQTNSMQSNAKRQCTEVATRPRSSGKIIVAKKSRLKKATSKSSVTVIMNEDSCEVVSMPTGRSTDQMKMVPSPPPFSSIIIDSAPHKVSVSKPFNSTSPERDKKLFMNAASKNKPDLVVVCPSGASKISPNDSTKTEKPIVNMLHMENYDNQRKEKMNMSKNPTLNKSNMKPDLMVDTSAPKSKVSAKVSDKGHNQESDKKGKNELSVVKMSSQSANVSDENVKSVAKPNPKFVLPTVKSLEKTCHKTSVYDSVKNTNNKNNESGGLKAKPPIVPADNEKDGKEGKHSQPVATSKEASETKTNENVKSNLPSHRPKSSILKSVSTYNLSHNDTDLKQPNSGSTANLHQSTSSLRQSSVLTKSLSNISCLSLVRTDSKFSLSQSSYSLAKSTDSLASNSSVSAERTRAAKMAFLEKQTTSNETGVTKDNLNNKFARYSLGLKKLSESRTSVDNLDVLPSSGTEHTTMPSNSDKRLQNGNQNVNPATEKTVPSNFKVDRKTSKLSNIVLVNGNKEEHREKITKEQTKESDTFKDGKHHLSNSNRTNKTSPSTNKKNSPSQGRLVASLIGKFQK